MTPADRLSADLDREIARILWGRTGTVEDVEVERREIALLRRYRSPTVAPCLIPRPTGGRPCGVCRGCAFDAAERRAAAGR